jgi:hypothetical protein
MNREDLIEYIESYEASHAVEEYIVNGWHVWPLLRMIPCMEYLPRMPPPALYHGGAAILRRWLRTTFPWLYELYKGLANREIKNKATEVLAQDIEHSDPYDAQRDVVILTLSERRVLQNGALYEIYSDPILELLNKLGMSTLVWEQGEERHPRYSKSAWITRRLNDETRSLPLPSHLHDEPRWFADYQTFTNEIIGRAVKWREVAVLIDMVTNQSIVFERWLRKTGARFLFVVCWYDPLIMAAIMAARRCGIKTIEIQHGVLGKEVFQYSTWLRAPICGFEVIPDIFWFWGAKSVEEIKQYSPAFSSSAILAGGNLWLNRWRQSMRSDRAPASNIGEAVQRKTILVTLQLDIEPFLFDAIAASPATWRWLIRFHPARDKLKRVQEEQMFKLIGHPGVELERANSILLLELLNESDVHVTSYSASAIEALAFGVPSIIIGAFGRKNFSHLINQGLMMPADTSEKLITEIECSHRMNPDETPAICNMFASDDEANEAMKYILKQKSIEVREP